MGSIRKCGSNATMFLAIFCLVYLRAEGQEMVVGINIVNPLSDGVADQNTLLSQLKAAQVHVIRCGISSDDKGIDFSRRAAAAGILLLLRAESIHARRRKGSGSV